MTRPRGRPPAGPDGEERSARLSVRIAPTVKTKLRAIAGRNGATIATTIQRLILDEHARRFPETS